ncbi:MAG: type II CRISPR RNA-guided endonuclease Cas9, partial [Pseudomonadota bacterium]
LCAAHPQGRSDWKDQAGAALIAKGRLPFIQWHEMAAGDRRELVDQLLHTEEEEELLDWLMASHGLDETAATMLARKTSLPSSYGRLSEKALDALVPIMAKESVLDEATGQPRPIRFDEACTKLGWHHSDKRTGEPFDRMPYYGEVLPLAVVDGPQTAEPDVADFGWVPNPTVHIGLNQLRQVINALIDRYGHPHEIVVELSRDLKLNQEQKKRRDRENTQNKKKRDEWRARMESELGIQQPSHRDFMKLRLWEEMPAQRRVCVFSGDPISFEQLFSANIEIEHIIPFSQSLDDGFMNKVLATREMNRLKGNRTPYEAFGDTPRWNEILGRISDLSKPKRDRFSADYVQERDFLARHLNDGRYLSRIARQYLTSICHPDWVWVIPGQLTAMLRGKWGLNDPLGTGNQKNRADHRHHAVDAFVVACTSRSMLNRLARASASAEQKELAQLVEQMPPPYERFDHGEFIERLRKVVVSHRPNRAYQGQMHNETAYFPTVDKDGKPIVDKRGTPIVAYRVPITSFTKVSDAEDIVDDDLQAAVLEMIEQHDGKALEQALGKLRDAAGNLIRRVKVKRPLSVIPIHDDRGKAYKAYKGDSNWCFEIVVDGKGKWKGRPVSTFEAYQRHRDGNTTPDDVVIQLFKDDMIDIQDPGDPDDPKARRILRVVKFSGNTLVTADHFEAGNLKARDADKDDPFKYLIKSADWYRKHDLRPGGRNMLGLGRARPLPKS